MKNIKTLLAALLIGATFAGCSSNSVPSSQSTPSASESNNSDASQVQTVVTHDEIQEVVLTMGSEIDSLDPLNSAATDTSAVMRNVFDSLIAFDTDGNMIAGLSELPEISEDGLTYTFNLKQGITYHNGEPFTSADVLYTYNQLAGLNGEEAKSSTLKAAIKAISAPDDYTVVMELNMLDAGFLTKCTTFIVQDGYTENATNPIGTGPYKFVSYTAGESIQFEINENYSTSADVTPTIDKVEVKIMTDTNASLMALMAGTVDKTSIVATNIEQLSDDFNVMNNPQNMVQVFALNNAIPGLDNPDVREAINLALNKEEIINFTMSGYGTQVETFLSPAMGAYYNDSIPAHTQDVETAKQLLVDAGYADGFTFTVKVPSNYQMHVDTAQVIKAQLALANITMEIEPIEWATWLEDVYANRDYEATIVGHTGKLDAQDFLNRFDTEYSRNYFNFSNERYDELIELAASTTDTEKRIEYYNECQEILVEETAAVYIQDPNAIVAVSKRLDGVEVYPVGFQDFASLRIVG